MKQYLLGIDGGGTKTDVLLCDQTGRMVARHIGGPSGLAGQDWETASTHVRESIEAVCLCAHIQPGDIVSVYAGISGCGFPAFRQQYEQFFAEYMPDTVKVRVGSDAVNALSASIGPEDGLIAISGTGSCVYGRRNGDMHRFGGYGYLLGDEGSGYDLGRRAITAALKAAEGRSGRTMLTEMLKRQFGDEETWFSRVYQTDARRTVASLAPVLLEAARLGDETALQELQEAEKGLADAILSAAARCHSERLVISGSIWKSQLYTEIMAELTDGRFEMIRPACPPVIGSVVEAAIQAGIPWKVFLQQPIWLESSTEKDCS